MTNQLKFDDYKLFIQMAKLVESYTRNFRRSTEVMKQGIKCFSGRNNQCRILVKQLVEFHERMLSRFVRDIVEVLLPDTFREEFEISGTAYIQTMEMD